MFLHLSGISNSLSASEAYWERTHRPASSESGAAIGAATPNPTRNSAVSRLTCRERSVSATVLGRASICADSLAFD